MCTAAIAGTDSAAQGVGAWKYDVLGALDHASEEFLKRNAKVTYFAWATIDRIVGRQIQLTNPDQSRTFVEMHMLDNRLYIFEATVPTRCARARTLSAVAAVSRCRRENRAIPRQLLGHVRPS